MKQKFNFDEALAAFQSGQPISGKDGILAPLVKPLIEAARPLDSHMTNSIVAVRRQFRKLTKTKGEFPNDNSLLICNIWVSQCE